MVVTKWVELPEGKNADFQDVYKYPGIPQAKGKKVNHNQVPTECKTGPEEPAEQQEQHQHTSDSQLV